MTSKVQATPSERAVAACQAYVKAMRRIRVITGQIGDALGQCPGNGEFDADTNGDPLLRTHLRAVYGHYDTAAVDAFAACPHCVLANDLVQQRKSARQSLGAAKRQITKAGKATQP